MPDSPVLDNTHEFTPMPTPDQVLAGDAGRRLDPIPFEFSDIRALAQRILKRAQEQGQQKIEAARKQVAAMEKQAHDQAYAEALPKAQAEGFAKGEKEGLAAAEKKIAAAIEGEKQALRQSVEPVTGILRQLAHIIHDNRQQLMAQAEGDLLLLSLDIAKRLVGHELSIDPEAIRPLAIEAIGLVTDRSAITARVHPEDFRVMNDILPDLQAIFPDLGPVRVEADAGIERGGLVASTREAEVDLRLATRFAAFEEAILGYSGETAIAPWTSLPSGTAEPAAPSTILTTRTPDAPETAGPITADPASPELSDTTDAAATAASDSPTSGPAAAEGAEPAPATAPSDSETAATDPGSTKSPETAADKPKAADKVIPTR
ncbi:MAG: hypothetical protein LIP77_09610, partial [Planctomycetes bacterium]|nr:hypothetical protein [Planctomycetota bacterium]